MTHTPPVVPDREARLTEALLSYVEARQDRGRLLAAYPDLRHDLEEFFAGHDEVERLTTALREGAARDFKPPSPPADLTHGLGKLGDFGLLREIGWGGMGVVYKAEQVSLHRRVALTCCRSRRPSTRGRCSDSRMRP